MQQNKKNMTFLRFVIVRRLQTCSSVFIICKPIFFNSIFFPDIVSRYRFNTSSKYHVSVSITGNSTFKYRVSISIDSKIEYRALLWLLVTTIEPQKLQLLL